MVTLWSRLVVFVIVEVQYGISILKGRILVIASMICAASSFNSVLDLETPLEIIDMNLSNDKSRCEKLGMK